MASNINKVFISGNMTRDAELRTTQGGTFVLNMGVAVNDRRRDPQTGEWGDYPNFIDCTMFGPRAEKIAPYLQKGTKVSIEGKLHYSQWQDRNTGQNRSKLDVTVEEIEFMSRQNAQSGGYQQQGGGYTRQTYTQPQAPIQGQQGAYQQPQQVVQDAFPGAKVDAYADEDIPF